MKSSANHKSVSGAHAGGAGPEAAGPDGPIVGTWSQVARWEDPSVTTRRLSIMAGVALGFLGLIAVAAGLARNFGGPVNCVTGAECSQLGVRYAQGNGGLEQDAALATRFFQRACDLGQAEGCNNLGLAFQSGEGLNQDFERAMDYFGRACSRGFAEGCNNQGAMYEHGQGVPENLGDATRLYTQACRHGSALGCSNLGVLYAQGRGVPANPTEAGRLFREACTAGSSVGCNNLIGSSPAPIETF